MTSNAGPMMAGTAFHPDPMFLLVDAINLLTERVDDLEKRIEDMAAGQIASQNAGEAP